MDRRTKILACLFGVAIAYVVLSRTVYPRWIEPLLTLDERVARRTKVLAALEDRQAEIDAAKREYVAMMARVGSTDIGSVEVDLRSKLNELIDAYGLKDAKISGGRARTDRKTKLKTMFIDVTAVASLESSVKFLKSVAELPQLVRVPRPKLSPASSSRKKKQLDRVNLNVPIEVMVLPDQKVIGRVDLEELNQPKTHVRHEDQDYALIWKRKPFMEYIPPDPLVVRIRNRRISVIEGTRVQLQASSVGGDGKYAYHWTPSDGLDNPTSAKTTVDTSKALSQTYTVHVSDGAGQSAKQTISVTVNAKPKPKERKKVAGKEPEKPKQQQKKKKKKPPWPGGENMQVSMALITGDGSQQVGELMLFDSRSQAAEYFKIGDDFDGGELVFLHQRGGVAVRNDEYFVYPIGMTLDRALPAEGAVDYPVLQASADRDRKAREAIEKIAREAAEQAKAEKAAADAAEKAKNAEPGQPVTKEGQADAADAKQPKNVAGMNPKNEAGQKPKTISVGQAPKGGKPTKDGAKPASGGAKPAKEGAKPAKGDAKPASKKGKSGGSKGARKEPPPKPVPKAGEKDKKQGKK